MQRGAHDEGYLEALGWGGSKIACWALRVALGYRTG